MVLDPSPMRDESVDVLDLLVREGLIDARTSEAVERSALPVVAAVVDGGHVTEDVLADMLARAARTIVIDLDLGTLEREALALVPESLARRRLLVPVALEPDARAVRVAFADPMDERALREVAELTGCAVRALVAPVSAIRRAIDREYASSSPTRVLHATRRELPAEPTRRLAAQPLGRDPDPGTHPVHRMEEEATPEQRHEALLLALIERGFLTRADYTDALKRLLGKR